MKLSQKLADLAARVLNTPMTTPEKQAEPTPPPAPIQDPPTRGAILAAALAWAEAKKTKNKAEQVMRRHRKILDLTESGAYGDVTISRVPNNREVPDMDRIQAIFDKHGLGQAPYKTCADSLVVTVNTPAAASA